MSYQKGDIVLVPVPFTNQRGVKRRPALIISDHSVHQTGDILVVQITSQFYNDSLTEPINIGDITQPLPKQSYIRCHKIFIVEQTLIIGKISTLKTAKYQQVIDRITTIIE